MKRRIPLIWLTLVWVSSLSIAQPIPKPSVYIAIKETVPTDGTNLNSSLTLFKDYFRKEGFPIQELEQANCRIEISGKVYNQANYIIRLVAFNNADNKLIGQTDFSSNPKVPLTELAPAIADLYTNPPERYKLDDDFSGRRKNFLRIIQAYFNLRQPSVVAFSTPTDTSGPIIEVYSPVIQVSRSTLGFEKIAKVEPSTTVTIIGKVSDASKVAQLTLNGKVIEVNADGTFRPVVNMTASKYDIVFEARDAVGNPRKLFLTLDPELLKPDKDKKDAPTADKRLALVIGNGAYEFVPRLGNPPNDAEAMATALRSVGFDMMPIVVNGNRKAILNAMNEFKDRLSREKYTVGLFYYAGHGVQHNGLNYIIPVEMGLKDDISTDCVEVQRVINQMEEANTRTNIIILDACRDDPFSKQRTVGGAGPALMEAPIGTFIAFATSPGSTAADGGGINGTYTAALLNHIQTPNLPIASVFQNIRNEVLRKTDNKQKPWESTSLTGDFYFRR